MKIRGKAMRMVAFAIILTVLTAFGVPSNGITAEARKTYHITAKAAAGGGITDEGTHNIKEGDDMTYHIYPDAGYRVNYVTIDGKNIGAVTEYTFEKVKNDHEIYVYFISGSAPDQNAVSKKQLNVLGSFSLSNGSGSYAPNTKVTVDAGVVAGFSFGGWLASDGKVYPSAKTTITMPGYDLILYANWVADGTPGALNQISTTNLKGEQALGWTAVTEKLATFTNRDLQNGSGSTMNVSMAGYNCYVDMAAIAALNTRPGMALNVSYGADVSFTFFGDVDNSWFMGTELSYTSTTKSAGALHEKEISFAEQGAIGTSISANVLLPEAAAGQTVYVYLVDAGGNETLYMSAVVDAANRIAVPLAAKVNFKVKY
ncbi:MAG: hypothetical protein K2N90_09155 [Lachnospiraceae bacterium]|nr:hypothetical protein [Lachnospiraceae bacterium]